MNNNNNDTSGSGNGDVTEMCLPASTSSSTSTATSTANNRVYIGSLWVEERKLRGNLRWFVGGYIGEQRYQKWFPTIATATDYASGEVSRMSEAKCDVSILAALLMSRNPTLKPTKAVRQAIDLLAAASTALAAENVI